MHCLARVAVTILLRSKLDSALSLFAICCNSYVPVSQGSTKRSFLTPMGSDDCASVRVGNLLASRLFGIMASLS